MFLLTNPSNIKKQNQNKQKLKFALTPSQTNKLISPKAEEIAAHLWKSWNGYISFTQWEMSYAPGICKTKPQALRSFLLVFY